MENNELVYNIINNSDNAIFAFDFDGKVIFWNSSAEKIFKYKREEILGKNLPFITSHSEHEIEAVINKAREGKQLTFKTQKKDKEGKILDLVLFSSPIYKENKVIGISVIIQEASILKKLAYIPLNIDNTYEKEQKRTFIEIRKLILATLFEKKKTINQIATDSGINWRTVEKHLTFLIGKKYAQEIFSSEYVRIFELTEYGAKQVEKIRLEETSRIIKE